MAKHLPEPVVRPVQVPLPIVIPEAEWRAVMALGGGEAAFATDAVARGAVSHLLRGRATMEVELSAEAAGKAYSEGLTAEEVMVAMMLLDDPFGDASGREGERDAKHH